jgi:hypothetical protein
MIGNAVGVIATLRRYGNTTYKESTRQVAEERMDL